MPSLKNSLRTRCPERRVYEKGSLIKRSVSVRPMEVANVGQLFVLCLHGQKAVSRNGSVSEIAFASAANSRGVTFTANALRKEDDDASIEDDHDDDEDQHSNVSGACYT
jgi:hypothetical protein